MDSKRNFITLNLNRMNKEKQHLVDLQSKIDQKSKELKSTNEPRMKKYVNYNELLDTLFKQWKNS